MTSILVALLIALFPLGIILYFFPWILPGVSDRVMHNLIQRGHLMDSAVRCWFTRVLHATTREPPKLPNGTIKKAWLHFQKNDKPVHEELLSHQLWPPVPPHSQALWRAAILEVQTVASRKDGDSSHICLTGDTVWSIPFNVLYPDKNWLIKLTDHNGGQLAFLASQGSTKRERIEELVVFCDSYWEGLSQYLDRLELELRQAFNAHPQIQSHPDPNRVWLQLRITLNQYVTDVGHAPTLEDLARHYGCQSFADMAPSVGMPQSVRV